MIFPWLPPEDCDPDATPWGRRDRWKLCLPVSQSGYRPASVSPDWANFWRCLSSASKFRSWSASTFPDWEDPWTILLRARWSSCSRDEARRATEDSGILPSWPWAGGCSWGRGTWVRACLWRRCQSRRSCCSTRPTSTSVATRGKRFEEVTSTKMLTLKFPILDCLAKNQRIILNNHR